MDQTSLGIKGVVRTARADELESLVAEGWEVRASFTEDELVPTYSEIANPQFRMTDDMGYSSNGHSPTLSVQSGTVTQRVTKFLLSMDPETVEGKLAVENKALRDQIEQLRQENKKLEASAIEATNNAAEVKLKCEAHLKESNNALLKVKTEYERLETERNQAREQFDKAKGQIQRIRDFVVVVWSEVGNERMRQVLGSRFPAELEDQTIPVQMAKTLFDHLLEEEGGA